MKKSILILSILALVVTSFTSCVKTCGCESMIQPQPPDNGGGNGSAKINVVYASDVLPSGVTREAVYDGHKRVALLPYPHINPYTYVTTDTLVGNVYEYFATRHDTMFVSGAPCAFQVSITKAAYDGAINELNAGEGAVKFFIDASVIVPPAVGQIYKD